MNFQTTMMELLKLQDKTNCGTISPEWKTAGHNWEIEVIAELGEAIESSNHKWWKENKLDLDNIKVEIIDMLHFAFSADMTSFSIETIKSCREPKWDKTVEEFSQDRFVEGCKGILKAVGNKYSSLNKTLITPSVLELANDVGMDLEEIRRMYIAKNALNLVRQQNGYKEGTYNKIWEGEEDNVKVMEYINQNPNDTMEKIVTIFDDLYKSMYAN